ncbi:MULTISPECIES: ROK family protein [Microbacterium]|uniref:ROK family protein n=1 Tax=Microbacterium TaxID=33882 RepID=UPI00217EF971|nr:MULTISPECIES: ROK family protein [Microbacterium]UWF77406.1 ROK family protein [Microbacterium neungamense]WCM55568.1 ROK family protein [Microbacterium sp. EF45047]
MTRYALAVDVGGTKLEAALVADDGTLVEGSRTRRPTGRSATPASLDAAVAEAVAHALAARPADAEIAGAGIGSAGPVDREAGTISPVNMPDARGYGLAAAVRRAASAVLGHDLPAVLGHDGGALALAESWLGATRGARASLSIVVSTGVGGGFVLGGAYAPGASGNAGHLGQVRREGGLTLEEIASGPASVAWARTQGWQGATGEDLAMDAAAGVAVARAAIERSAKAVGEALADAATLVDLDVIAVGGGFSRVSDDYVELVQRALTASAVHDYSRRARVVRSGLGDEGPLIGAAALALR